MRTFYFHIIVLFSLAGCQKYTVVKPTWLNETKTVQLPDASLQFASPYKNWKACLQGFIQPVPLQLQYQDSGFVIKLLHREGISEGPAQIILNSGEQYFYYNLLLVNKQIAATKKDYRSPKTVNPDSSLQQQRILHQVDANRNILYENAEYFSEEEITLAPKAGTYRAIASEPLSAYYVQAGSCVSIPIKSSYKKENEVFTVTAGPLKDKFNNTVADGTLVTFIYFDGVQTYRMEAALLNGIATVFIPSGGKKYTLTAKVNNTISHTITLIP
jgi:hypothetical protein